MEIFSQFLKSTILYELSGIQFSVMTLRILGGSQIDAGSLIQDERNEKALRRKQKKIICARSTLDWSQSNNISCTTLYSVF